VEKSWHRVGRIIANLDLYLSCIILALLICLTFVGVFMRYLFSTPIVWQEEVQLACFLWITFLGGCAAFRTGGHVAIEIIVDRFPRKIRVVIEILVSVIVIALLGFLMKNGFTYLALLISASRQTSILRIPYVLIYGILPWACILMCINQIYVIVARYWPKKNAADNSAKGDAT